MRVIGGLTEEQRARNEKLDHAVVEALSAEKYGRTSKWLQHELRVDSITMDNALRRLSRRGHIVAMHAHGCHYGWRVP